MSDIFFVANVSLRHPDRLSVGWSVYRKCEDQEPRDTSRIWVRVVPPGPGILGERMSIPRGAVKLKTRELHKAARAASVFNEADKLEAACVAAAKAQRKFTFDEIKDRYDTP